MAVPSFNDFLKEVTSLGKAETGFNVKNELGFSPADYTKTYAKRLLIDQNPLVYLPKMLARTFGADVGGPSPDEPKLPMALQLPETLFDMQPLAKHWAMQAPDQPRIGWEGFSVTPRDVAMGAAQLTSPFDVGITALTLGFGTPIAAGLRGAAAGTGVIGRNKALKLGAKGAAALVEPLASTGTKSGLARALGLELGTGLAAETGLRAAEREGLPMWAALPIGLASGGAFLGTAMGAKKAIDRFGSHGNRTAAQMEEVIKFPSDVPPSALPEASEFLFVARNMDEATSMIGEFTIARNQNKSMSKGLDLQDFLKIDIDEGTWPQAVAYPDPALPDIIRNNAKLWNDKLATEKYTPTTTPLKKVGPGDKPWDEVIIPLQPRDLEKMKAVGTRFKGLSGFYGVRANGTPVLFRITKENLITGGMVEGSIGQSFRLGSMEEVEAVARRINEILEDTRKSPLQIDPDTLFGKLRKARTHLRTVLEPRLAPESLTLSAQRTAQFFRQVINAQAEWIRTFPDPDEEALLEALQLAERIHTRGLDLDRTAGQRALKVIDDYIKENEAWALQTKRALEDARDPSRRIADLKTRGVIDAETGNLKVTTSKGIEVVTEIKSVDSYVKTVGNMYGVDRQSQEKIAGFLRPFMQFLAEGFGISEEDAIKNMLVGVADRQAKSAFDVPDLPEHLKGALAVTHGLPTQNLSAAHWAKIRASGAMDVNPDLHFAPMQSLISLFQRERESPRGTDELGNVVTLVHEFFHVIMNNLVQLLPPEQYEEFSHLIKQQIAFTRKTLYPLHESDDYAELVEEIISASSVTRRAALAKARNLSDSQYNDLIARWMDIPSVKAAVLSGEAGESWIAGVPRGARFMYNADPDLLQRVDILGDSPGSRAWRKSGDAAIDDYKQLAIKIYDPVTGDKVKTDPWHSQVAEAGAEIFSSFIYKMLTNPNYRPALGVTRGDQWMNDMFRKWAEMLLKLMRDFRAYWERGLKAIDKEGYGIPSPEHARWPTAQRYTKTGPHGMAEGWRGADGQTWDRVEKLLDDVRNAEFRPLSVPMAGEMLVPANKQGGNRLLLERLMAAKVQRRVGDYLSEKEASLLRVNLANLLIGFDATELIETLPLAMRIDLPGTIDEKSMLQEFTPFDVRMRQVQRTLLTDVISPQQYLTPFGVSLTPGEHLRHIWRVLKERKLLDPREDVPFFDESGSNIGAMWDDSVIDALPLEAWATRVSMSKALLREIGQLSFAQRNSLEPLYEASYLNHNLEPLTSMQAAQADQSGFRFIKPQSPEEMFTLQDMINAKSEVRDQSRPRVGIYQGERLFVTAEDVWPIKHDFLQAEALLERARREGTPAQIDQAKLILDANQKNINYVYDQVATSWPYSEAYRELMRDATEEELAQAVRNIQGIRRERPQGPTLFFHAGVMPQGRFRHSQTTTSLHNTLFGPGLLLTDHALIAGMDGVSSLQSAKTGVTDATKRWGGALINQTKWNGIVEAFHVAVPSENIMRLDGIGKSDPVGTRFFNNLFGRLGTNDRNYETTFGPEVVSLANSYFREALDEVAQWPQHGYANFNEALTHFTGRITEKFDYNNMDIMEGPARVANSYNGSNASWMMFTHMAAMVATLRAVREIGAPMAIRGFPHRSPHELWRTRAALMRRLRKELDEVKEFSENLYNTYWEADFTPDMTPMREGGTKYFGDMSNPSVDARSNNGLIARIIQRTSPSMWNVMKGFEEADIPGTRGYRYAGDKVAVGEHIEPEEFLTYRGLADDFFSVMLPHDMDQAAQMMLGQISNGQLLNQFRLGQGWLLPEDKFGRTMRKVVQKWSGGELRDLELFYREANVEALTFIGGGNTGIPHRLAMLVGNEDVINNNLVKRENLSPEAPSARLETNFEYPRKAERLPTRDKKTGRFVKKTSMFSTSQFSFSPSEATKKLSDAKAKLEKVIRKQIEALKEKKILGSSRQGGAADVVDLNKKASKGDVVPNLDVTDANIDPPIYKGKPTRWNNIVPRELDEVLASDPSEGLRLADGTITNEGNASIAVAIIRKMPELLEKSWELVKVNEEILAANRRRKAAISASLAEQISDPRQLAIAQMGALRGEMTALGFEPMSMDVKEFAALLSYAQQRLGERSFDVVNAKIALEKLTGHSFDPSVEPGLAARHLQRNEIMLIERLFGFDIAALAATRSRQLRTREKILRALVDFLNIPRILLLGGDFGGLFNQGLLFAGRPKAYLKAAAEGLKSFAIPRNFEQAMRDIEGHQHFAKFFSPPGVRSGVNGEGGYGAYFADLNSPLSLREEQFVSEYLRRIPGIGHMYKAFERFHVAFLNKLRFDMMQSAYLVFKNSGAKQADIDRQMRTYADWVNKGTGRGNIWKANELTAGLNTIFLAPRWVVSRFQVPVAVAKELGSYSINRTTGRPVKNNLVAKQIAKDMVGFATVIGGIATLLSLNGFQVGTDHRKSDFLKLTKGRTNIDLTAGMGSVFRFIFRAGSVSLQGATEGEPFRGKLLSATGVEYDKNLWDVSSDFLNMKFSPAVRTVDTLVTGRNFYGEDIDAERAFLPTDLKTLQEWAPLWIQEVGDAAEQLGTSSAASLLLPSLAGLNVAIYPDKNDLALEALGRNYTEAWPFEQESIDMLYYEESRFSPSEYSENNYALNSLFLDEMEKVLSNPNISDTQKSYQISKRYHDLNKEKRGIRLQAFGADDQGREDEYPLRVSQQEFYEYKDSLYDPATFAGSNSAYEYAELLEQIYLDGLTEIEREYILANMYMLPLPMELLDLKTTTGESPGWVKRVTQARELQAKVVRRHGLEAAPFDPSLYEETREMQRNIGGETYAQEVAIAN